MSKYFIFKVTLTRYYPTLVNILSSVIVFIRPLFLIRFGRLLSERIGHFAIDPEVYLLNRKDQSALFGTLDIITCDETVCNEQLKKMWARVFNIYKHRQFYKDLIDACNLKSKSKVHFLPLYDSGDQLWKLTDTQTKLSFTREEEERGLTLLKSLGIPRYAQWICFHNRDSSYLESVLTWDASYHNYRDFSIESMCMAAEEFARRGYYVVRMGAIQKGRLETSNEKIVDYSASEFRSDFGDIYLGAHCKAYFGSDSGILCIPQIFRKHICQVNYAMTQIDSLVRYANYSLPFITKHLWMQGTDRLLSLREMFELGLHGATTADAFYNRGIHVIENTPEDMLYLAAEVDERLRGVWIDTDEDKELQRRFWEIYYKFSKQEFKTGTHPRIGSMFLKQYPHLLE